MTNRDTMIRSFVLGSICAAALIATGALAQVADSPIRISNVWRADQSLNVESGSLKSSPAMRGWHSAQWLPEVAITNNGERAIRFKNKWNNTYLHSTGGKPDAVNVNVQNGESYWILEPIAGATRTFRLKNWWTKTYLNTESGNLDLSNVPANYGTSQWNLIGYNGPEKFTQCVSNVLPSGIAATVKWYYPRDVTLVPADPRGDNADTKDIDESVQNINVGFAKPAKEQSITVGFSSCVGGTKSTLEPLVAVVSVFGAKYVNSLIGASIGSVIAIASAAACPFTATATCSGIGFGAALASGGASLAVIGIPDSKEVFYIGVPGTVEVKGTAWSPIATETVRLNLD
jgi:hypothetical protein